MANAQVLYMSFEEQIECLKRRARSCWNHLETIESERPRLFTEYVVALRTYYDASTSGQCTCEARLTVIGTAMNLASLDGRIAVAQDQYNYAAIALGDLITKYTSMSSDSEDDDAIDIDDGEYELDTITEIALAFDPKPRCRTSKRKRTTA